MTRELTIHRFANAMRHTPTKGDAQQTKLYRAIRAARELDRNEGHILHIPQSTLERLNVRRNYSGDRGFNWFAATTSNMYATTGYHRTASVIRTYVQMDQLALNVSGTV